MGLFSSLLGRKTKTAKHAQTTITATYVPSCDNSDNWKHEMEEQLRKRDEGNRIKKQRLNELGANVDQITEYAVGTDANYFLRRFLPLYRQPNSSTEAVTIEYENLTSTGKVPKNVAIGTYGLERNNEYGTGEALNVRIKYLADATPNMADIYIFKKRKSLNISIRKRDGDFCITFAEASDLDLDVRTMLYHEKENNNQEEAMTSIAYELGKME